MDMIYDGVDVGDVYDLLSTRAEHTSASKWYTRRHFILISIRQVPGQI